MTDLEMTLLCAEAMGLDTSKGYISVMCQYCDEYGLDYDPLHNDAQAMALVKKFGLDLHQCFDRTWVVRLSAPDPSNPTRSEVESGDLNRAIVECVATMQAAK